MSADASMSINVIRKVVVKAIVTQEFKDKLFEELDNSIAQSETRLQQLDFEKKRVSLRSGRAPKDHRLVRQLDTESERVKNLHRQFTRKREEVEKLEFNSEYVQGTIDSPVHLQEGDNFYDLLTKTEILVKDGNVIEIRNP